jgi:integrase
MDVEKHLIPESALTAWTSWSPRHFEKLYAKMQRGGLKPGTAHHVHRTVRAALNEAVRRKHLAANPVIIAKAPRLDEEEVEPYDLDEIQQLLRVVSDKRNGARWVVALSLGLRQGSAWA